jgi:hypothetical protein
MNERLQQPQHDAQRAPHIVAHQMTRPRLVDVHLAALAQNLQ